VGREPDVWGTVYALYLGVLNRKSALSATRRLIDAVQRGTILYESAVRHVPLDHDYSPESAWERTAGVKLNTYQNGAFWHTPTGWLISVLQREEPTLASRIFQGFIDHLRQDDFRLGGRHQAPWECIAPGGYAQNGVYMASVATPLSSLSSSKVFASSLPQARQDASNRVFC
jgi:hypothetical protein